MPRTQRGVYFFITWLFFCWACVSAVWSVNLPPYHVSDKYHKNIPTLDKPHKPPPPFLIGQIQRFFARGPRPSRPTDIFKKTSKGVDMQHISKCKNSKIISFCPNQQHTRSNLSMAGWMVDPIKNQP